VRVRIAQLVALGLIALVGDQARADYMFAVTFVSRTGSFTMGSTDTLLVDAYVRGFDPLMVPGSELPVGETQFIMQVSGPSTNLRFTDLAANGVAQPYAGSTSGAYIFGDTGNAEATSTQVARPTASTPPVPVPDSLVFRGGDYNLGAAVDITSGPPGFLFATLRLQSTGAAAGNYTIDFADVGGTTGTVLRERRRPGNEQGAIIDEANDAFDSASLTITIGTPTVVPVPATLVLAAIGAPVVGLLARRRARPAIA
jgi:hypothetical protein